MSFNDEDTHNPKVSIKNRGHGGYYWDHQTETKQSFKKYQSEKRKTSRRDVMVKTLTETKAPAPVNWSEIARSKIAAPKQSKSTVSVVAKKEEGKWEKPKKTVRAAIVG